MKTMTLMFAAVCAVVVLGCSNAGPGVTKCSAQSCANGCCSAAGECVTAASQSACGLNGLSCATCAGGQTCGDGVCRAPDVVVDAGPVDAGSGDGDGGIDCATLALDPMLGDLVLRNGATLVQGAVLPTGITTVGVNGATLYGVGSDHQLYQLGSLPNLVKSAPLANVRSPADEAANASVFLGGSLAVSGTQLLAGYTKSGAGFPGNVVVYDTADAGVQYVSAPANYTAVGFQGSFLINGGQVGGATGAGVYALDAQGAFGFSTFDAAWMASNGFTGVTSNGVLLLGYFDGTDFQNHVRAVPASQYASAFAARTSFPLAGAVDVASGDDLQDLTTFGEDAILVRGGYDSNFESFTTQVTRVTMSVAGSGVQTVSAGRPVPFVEATHRCTRVVFAVGGGTQLLLGVSDRNGRRVLRVLP